MPWTPYSVTKSNPELLLKERQRNREKERLARALGKRKKASTEKQREYLRRKRAKNPVQYAAYKQWQHYNPLKKPCEICGSLKSQAHHDDYAKPLEVRWFCYEHHTQHHVALSEAKLRMPTTSLAHNGKHSATAKPIQKTTAEDMEVPF